MVLPVALTIGAAAKAAGVTRKAVRVYEAKGLLPDPERTEAGYRLYTDHDVALLRFIRRARALGLRLDDIGDIIASRAAGTAPCAQVRMLLDARIGEIDATLAALHALRANLVATRQGVHTPAGQTASTCCAIIETAAPT